MSKKSKKMNKFESELEKMVYDEDKKCYTCRKNGRDYTSTDGKTWLPTSIEVKVPKTSSHVNKHDDSPTHILDARKYALANPGLFSSQFVKNDSDKLKWSLLPFEELKDVVKVLMRGAEKYSADNWKKCNDTTRYKDALMRHVIAYVSGEKTDEEFGLSHLAHAICNCLFLMWFDNNKKEEE